MALEWYQLKEIIDEMRALGELFERERVAVCGRLDRMIEIQEALQRHAALGREG